MILYRYFAREVYGTLIAVASLILVIAIAWRFQGIWPRQPRVT